MGDDDWLDRLVSEDRLDDVRRDVRRRLADRGLVDDAGETESTPGVSGRLGSVRVHTAEDGREEVHLVRVDSEGRQRSVPVADAVEAALWRETDLERSRVPDVEGRLDLDELRALAAGDRAAVRTRIAGRVVVLDADGDIEVKRRFEGLRRGLSQLAEAVGEHADRESEASDADADDADDATDESGSSRTLRTRRTDDGPRAVVERTTADGDVRTVPIENAIEAAIWRESDLDRDEVPDATTAFDPEDLVALADGELRGLTADVEGYAVTVAEDGTIDVRPGAWRRYRSVLERTGVGDLVDVGADEPDVDEEAARDAFTVRTTAAGDRRVYVERTDEDGTTRQVPVGEAVEAALVEESDLEADEIPDFEEQVDREQLVALADGELPAVSAKFADHTVTVNRDGTITVNAPITAGRRSMLKVAGVATAMAAWGAIAGGAVTQEEFLAQRSIPGGDDGGTVGAATDSPTAATATRDGDDAIAPSEDSPTAARTDPPTDRPTATQEATEAPTQRPTSDRTRQNAGESVPENGGNVGGDTGGDAGGDGGTGGSGDDSGTTGGNDGSGDSGSVGSDDGNDAADSNPGSGDAEETATEEKSTAEGDGYGMGGYGMGGYGQ